MEVVNTETTLNEYKFTIYPGNHPEVIREGFKRRGNMMEIPYTTPEDKLFSDVNFIWKPFGYSRKSLIALNKQSLSTPIVICLVIRRYTII